MYCKYQRLVFSRRGVLPADRMNEAPKVQMPRWNDIISTNTTIHHSTNTATADAYIQDFCTAITIQCFSYAIRSQSVLTTIQLGVSTMFITAHAYHERDSFHSLIAYTISLDLRCYPVVKSNLPASSQSTVDSFAFGEVQITSNGKQTKQTAP